MDNRNSKSQSKQVSCESARIQVAKTIGKLAGNFPNLYFENLDTAKLNKQDASLATAIYKTTVKRWVTLDYILNIFLKKPLIKLEPALQGVLLTGAGQLLFMNKLPAYAVVNESTNIAKNLVRPGAGAIVNAVLRKVANLIDKLEAVTWQPAKNKLPVIDNNLNSNSANSVSLILNKAILPDTNNLAKYLSIATSSNKLLINKWLRQYGKKQTISICLHNLQTPPTIVKVENNFSYKKSALFEKHEKNNFILWQAGRSQLIDFLKDAPARRVQDPASALAIKTAAKQFTKTPTNILDLCAGKGTKTIQLATKFPDSKIIASDTDSYRFDDLKLIALNYANITVVEPDKLESATIKFDLILLDVPCSNSGVLSRRPEANNRFNTKHLNSLINSQRQIATKAIKILNEKGSILYSTCSLEKEENQNQAQWIKDKMEGKIIYQHQELPEGYKNSFHNGSFHALIR